MRRLVNTFFSLAPAPLFLVGSIWSWFTPSICGTAYEMPIMWLIMSLAHVSPWLAWWQLRDLHKFQTLPDKQQ